MTPESAEQPRVSILITTRNRPSELKHTLELLGRQTYRPWELIVIDDASDVPLETIVKGVWPDAVVVRNGRNVGLIASRSFGMLLATGDFIVSLDDDSCFTDSNDIVRAVAYLLKNDNVGLLTFLVHHGRELKDVAAIPKTPVCVHSFVGCGHIIRKAVVKEIGGYQAFFEYYAEEHDYSLRMLAAGWYIVFFPSVIVHHRVSSIGRHPGRIWAYSLRNNLWTALLHFPARNCLLELVWKCFVGTLDALRLFQIKWLFWAIWSTTRGLPRVLRLRQPISKREMLLYDGLRFGAGVDPRVPSERFPISWSQRWRWLSETWLKRRRARSFWDRRKNGIGRSELASFPRDIPR